MVYAQAGCLGASPIRVPFADPELAIALLRRARRQDFVPKTLDRRPSLVRPEACEVRHFVLLSHGDAEVLRVQLGPCLYEADEGATRRSSTGFWGRQCLGRSLVGRFADVLIDRLADDACRELVEMGMELFGQREKLRP
jgi:hypothetical protein